MKTMQSLFHGLKLQPVTLVLLGAFSAVAAYLQALYYPFVIDDTSYITENTRLAELHLAELWRLFTEPYNSMAEFLPLRELSYWIDIKLFGLTPAAFRLHNILLYLLCLPLVYGCTLKIWCYSRPTDAPSASWVAAVVTTLFALHPSHAEAVVWIAGRKDLLSGMFSLLALWLALNARREHGLSARYAAGTLAALMAAMLSKATAVAMAPLIAILWVFFWRDISGSRKSRIQFFWPIGTLVLAAGLAFNFSSMVTTKVPFYFGWEALTRTLAALGWLARLGGGFESRHFFYPVFEDPHLAVMVVLGIVILATTLAGAVLLWNKRSIEGFALVAFMLFCLPNIQLIPYAPPSIVSDRFVFLAVWPLILLAVSLSLNLKPVLRTILFIATILLWGGQTIVRPRDWSSFQAVVEADMSAFPGYYMPAVYKIVPQMEQGLIRDAGETASGINDPDARNIMIRLINADNMLRALVLEGGNQHAAVDVLMELGGALKKTPDKALWDSPMYAFWKGCRILYMRQWIYLIKHFPGDILLRYYAGLSSLDVEEYRGAEAFLRLATESNQLPNQLRGSAFYGYGFALVKKGSISEAEMQLRAALEQSPPDLRAHCALADVYRQTGRHDEAARAEAACHTRGGS